MAEYIDREVVLSKCDDIWNAADETTQTGVDTINTIDEVVDFIESLPSADVQPVKLILQIVQGRLNGANYTMLEAVKSNDTNAAYKMRGAIDICSEILADLRILTAKDGEQNG